MTRRVKAFDVVKESAEIMNRKEAEILTYNKGQLMSGVNKDGTPLRDYYFAWYADFKSRLNGKGVTDLYVTGQFHDKFYLTTNQDNTYTVNSQDGKTYKLINGWVGKSGVSVPGYGPKIFGFTEESKRMIRDRIMYPEMKKVIDTKIF